MALVRDRRRCVGLSLEPRYWSDTGSVSDPVSKRRWMVGSLHLEAARPSINDRTLIFNKHALLAASVAMATRFRLAAWEHGECVTLEAPDAEVVLSKRHGNSVTSALS